MCIALRIKTTLKIEMVGVSLDQPGNTSEDIEQEKGQQGSECAERRKLLDGELIPMYFEVAGDDERE